MHLPKQDLQRRFNYLILLNFISKNHLVLCIKTGVFYLLENIEKNVFTSLTNIVILILSNIWGTNTLLCMKIAVIPMRGVYFSAKAQAHGSEVVDEKV